MKNLRTVALLATVAAIAAAALAPRSAAAGGGPVLVTVAPDGTGIDSSDGLYRYATVLAGSTVAVKVTKGTGELVSGYAGESVFGIPQVAADGSTSGLSADGSTLVLIRAYGPPGRSSLVVIGTNRLRIKKRIGLAGQYSFDAISPDGRNAYVVEYPRPFQFSRYRVLKLDLETGRLAKEPIADEDVGLEEAEDSGGEVEGEMRGTALSRVDSEDGRWAYTLYDGGGDVPFIHALDTVGDEAVCVFMPELEQFDGKQIRRATIASGEDPETLEVVTQGGGVTTELA